MVIVEAGRELRFADQALAVGYPGLLGAKHLEGDHAMERFVPGSINNSHAAAAQLVQQAERAYHAQVRRDVEEPSALGIREAAGP